MAETRKVIDCRRFPAEKPCSIVISGTEDDVLDLAVLHAKTVHGHLPRHVGVVCVEEPRCNTSG